MNLTCWERAQAAVAIALLCASVSAEVLVLRSGELRTGKVAATAPDSVTLESADSGRVTYPAELISPRSFVALRGESLPDDATQELLDLSDYAALTGLFRDARNLLTRVEGSRSRSADATREAGGTPSSGAADPVVVDLAARRQTLRQAEARWLLTRANQSLKGEELGLALEDAKTLMTDFADTQPGVDARALADLIIAAQRVKAEGAAAAADEALAAEGDKARAKAMEKAQAAFQKSAGLYDEAEGEKTRCLEHIEQGNRTLMRKSLEAAEARYGKAKAYLGALPQLLRGQARSAEEETPGGKLLAEGEKRVSDIDDALVRVYARVAQAYITERNFRSAHELVQKGMALRPNDTNMRDLDKEISENWKRRSAADRSNAHPRVRSGP